MTIRKALLGFDRTKKDDWLHLSIKNGLLVAADDISSESLSLKNNAIDLIICNSALQQLPVYDLLSALRELYRLLKPGGVLRLCLFDLDRAIDAYQTSRSDNDYFWCWDWETASGRFITQITDYGYTRTPLTYEFSEELLLKAGFQKVERVAAGQTHSHYAEIVELDSHLEQYFYVEAVKQTELGMDKQAVPGTPTQIHCSWVKEPSNSLTVMWHTPSQNNRALVEYRQSGSSSWNRATGNTKPSPGKGYLHRVTLTGLLTDTEYEYRISSDEGIQPTTSKIFQTRTAPVSGTVDFSFAFICDTGIIGRLDGNATGTQPIIAEIINDKPLFILGGGDYAYANRDNRYREIDEAIDAWFVQMQPLIARFPFMAQYGNHEILLEERFRDWAPRLAHPKGFDEGKNYSFDVGEVHFTALFVPDPSQVNLEQLAWLDADLQDARNRGMRWLIVYQHEPIYGHGHSHPANPMLRQLLCPIFEKYRVDLHLSGHDQNYERTYPLLGVPYHPTPTSNSLNYYEAGSGVIYAKVSPSGKLSEFKNDFSRFTVEQQPFIACRDDAAHHYALVTVKTKKLMVNAYSVVNKETPKTLCDSFYIFASE